MTDSTSRTTPRQPKMVIQPPKYNGKGDVTFFLEEFERAGNGNGWDDKQRLEMLPNFLTDSAKSWYRVYTDDLRNSTAVAPTWKEFKEALEAAFEVTAKTVKYRIMLNNRNQGPSEVESYYYNVMD